MKLYFPLGFPVRLSANSEAVKTAAEEAWADWQPLTGAEPVDVRVDVQANDAADTREVCFTGGADGFQFSAGESNWAGGEWLKRTISIRVSEHTIRDRAYFRYHFLEAAVNQLISGLHFAPIHAACVTPPAWGGILLCGDSGAGKSSLAFACARQDWTYTTDDASFLVRNGGCDVVGDAHRVRMRPESVSLFPELARMPATPRGNGDVRLQMRTSDLRMRSSPVTTIERAVLLQRNATGSVAKLSAWNRSAAEEWFSRVFYHWAPSIAREQARSLAALLDRVHLEVLTYSRLEDAVRALEG